MTIVTGAVGTAMLVYGIRQKEPLPLVFGIVIGLIPMFTGSGALATALFLALGAAFLVLRKRL
jgi:hypothetical protein